MQTRFVDLSALEEKCMGIGIEKGMGIGLEKGMGIGIEKGMGIGLEKGMEQGEVNTICKMIQAGLPKPDILKIIGCSQELYNKAYQLANTKKI